MSITVNGTSGLTFPDGSSQATAWVPGMRNRIINGDFRIDQRNAGASVTPASGNYTLDRWVYNASQASKVTIQQNAGSVTPPTGFKNYLGLTVGASANVTIGAGDYFDLEQRVEGCNASDLGWGSVGASSVTLSFWVRSSLTGTFGGSLRNSGSTRSYPFSYSIPVANTWTQISITIAGDTTGTWLTNNGVGIYVGFALGYGSTYGNGTAGAWVGSDIESVTGAVSVVSTNSATFYITGVQLEKGSTATSFDYRPYGTELALCQRYYQKSYNADVAPGTSTLNGYLIYASYADAAGYFYGFIPPKVTMRAAPTMTYYTHLGVAGKWKNAAAADVTIVANFVGDSIFPFQFGTVTAGSSGQAYGHFVASAEL